MPILTCPSCGKEYEKGQNYINQAARRGLKLFCSQDCFGVSRRKGLTIEQKKAVKAEYDKQYRYYHRDGIKERKAAQFKIDYAANPEKYKQERKRRYPAHLEYLRSERYKEWKKPYDAMFCAKKQFGEEYAEAVLILKEIEKLLPSKEIKYNYSITQAKSTQKRKRLCNSLQAKISKTSFG